MSVTYYEREGNTWEERVAQVVSMIEEHHGLKVPNPQDAVCNVLCNSCGRIAAATADRPPRGWKLGAFGEDDLCPDCR